MSGAGTQHLRGCRTGLDFPFGSCAHVHSLWPRVGHTCLCLLVYLPPVALGCHLPTSGLLHVLSSRGPFLCHLGCVSCTCFLFGQFWLIPRSPVAAVLVGSSSARGCSARGPFLLEALVTGLDDGRGLWRKAPPLPPGLVLLGPVSRLSGFAVACGVDMPCRASGRQCPLSWRPACLWYPKPSACHPFSELLAEVVLGAIIQPSFSVFKAFKRSTFPE